MSSTITTTEQPATEPVTLDEARAQLRIDEDNTCENDLITGYIKTARLWVENHIKRKLITQTLTWRSSCLFGGIELAPNLQTINSVKYIDTSGSQQTIDSAVYQYNKYALVGYILPNFEQSWPDDIRSNLNSVEIEFIAGYGVASDVPPDIKNAILLLVSDYYENRGATYVGVSVNKQDTVENLLSNYRVLTVT